jgi:hypothetical protein
LQAYPERVQAVLLLTVALIDPGLQLNWISARNSLEIPHGREPRHRLLTALNPSRPHSVYFLESPDASIGDPEKNALPAGLWPVRNPGEINE